MKRSARPPRTQKDKMLRQRLSLSSPSGRSIPFGEGLAETGQTRQRLGGSSDLTRNNGFASITATMVLTQTKQWCGTCPKEALGVLGGLCRVHGRKNSRQITRTAACGWATKAAPRVPCNGCKEAHHAISHRGCTCNTNIDPTASTTCIAPSPACPANPRSSNRKPSSSKPIGGPGSRGH